MPLPADHWQRALALMDTAVTLRPEQRDAWLDDIAASEPQVAPLLRKLLGAHRRVETNDILATLPRPDRQTQHQSNGEIGAQIGPFALLELLGHGGMGSVWRARYADGRLKRDVAVKLPATSDNPAALASLRERFARERDFLAQLEHPNIARLYETGVSDSGQPYLAMEYVAGEPIDAYCDKHRLTIKARLTLYLQVLDAVEFAHRRLVLHRDLKPGNVLVDESGQVRLLDFGVAKLLPETSATASATTSISAGTDLTEMAGAAITLAYAAPEQINNGRLSTATDVYALGVMLYRLLTGSAPYEASRDTRGALEEAVLTAIPANPSSVIAALDVLDARQTTASALRRALAGDIDTIVAKALKKDADERYPTAAAFAADLRRNLARQPIAARPDSAWYRARRFYARHPFAVAASTLAITALLASFCVTVWHARETAATLVRANTAAARGANAQKFLTSMFASADPERSKSNELASVEILQRGTVAAERDFADDPEGHALVLKQIADIYRRMSMFDEVLATQQRRLAVLQGAPSADVDSLVEAELEVGRALGDTSHDADHQRAMAQLLNARERAERFGAKPENVVWALSLIADQFRFERNLVAARHHAEQALDLAQKALSSPNRFFAITYEVNALVATDQRRVEDARSYFKKALDIDATGQGRGPIDQFLSRNYLAQLEFVDGRYGAALEQSMLGIELAKKNFGGMNISLVEAIRTAAFAAAQHGDIATAERLAAAPLDAEVATGQTLRAGVAHFTRARVALHAGDVPRARVELTAAQSRVAGSAVWEPRVTLARSMLELRANNAQGAFEIATALLQSQVAKRGASHPELSATYQWLALTEYRTGRHEAARAHLQQALNGYSALRAAHPLRIRCAAYAVLMNPDLASAAKSEELLRLERVLAMDAGDAGDASPLAISLQRGKDSLATLKNNVWPNAAFPILD